MIAAALTAAACNSTVTSTVPDAAADSGVTVTPDVPAVEDVLVEVDVPAAPQDVLQPSGIGGACARRAFRSRATALAGRSASRRTSAAAWRGAGVLHPASCGFAC
ncbi:MAG: hypothetical protein U0325_27730 [Polyangiales bacterium]